MKKLTVLVLVSVLCITSVFSGFSYADSELSYEESHRLRLEHNREWKSYERTDEYALHQLSFPRGADGLPYKDPEVIKDYPEHCRAIEEATKGLTSEYARAKAIYEWLTENMTYTNSPDDWKRLEAEGVPSWLYGVCEQYMYSTELLMNLAGFPAKKVVGLVTSDNPFHGWNEVYIDGRWVFVDTTWRMFDTPIEEWSRTHYVTGMGHSDWYGSLIFRRTSDTEDIKEIKTYPLNAPLTTTYGYAPSSLYLDRECTDPLDLSTYKFDFMHSIVWVKAHSVVFYTQLDNEYKSIENHIVRKENGTEYSGVHVEDGGKLPQVPLPVKQGYTFIGWKELGKENAKIWNTATDKVIKDMALLAVFKKGNISCKINFNSNGGSAVKEVTTLANTKINQPSNPTKIGEKFTGWYKDKAGTEVWDFTKDIVQSDTTLYAGWGNANKLATPITSKVLVDGKPVDFEAYTIDGSNYFKLRDLAYVVNGTPSTFEVAWDGSKNAINLLSAASYTSTGSELSKGAGTPKGAVPTTSVIYKDGILLSLTAYNIDSANYFKLRDIAEKLGIKVTWDNVTKTIGIDTGKDNEQEKNVKPVSVEKTFEQILSERNEKLYKSYGLDSDDYKDLVKYVQEDIAATDNIADTLGFLKIAYTRYHKLGIGKSIDLTVEEYMLIYLLTFYDVAESKYSPTELYIVEGPEAIKYVISTME